MPERPVPFAERFARLRDKRGPFCLGLDPSPALLTAWALEDDIWGLKTFCDRVIDAAAQQVAVIKPQSAYFERFGAAGLEVLSDVMDAIGALGSLSLLDAKRGDIGSTNEAYASALLGPDSAMGADALTVNPYLGFGALQPFVDRVATTGGGLFVLVLSSNPEGRALQAARVDDERSVAELLCDEITAHNRKAGAAVGPVGAVVGLTAQGAPEVAARLPASLLLCPGLGAQGGTFAELATRFAAARGRVIPTSSRGVLAAGPDVGRLAEAIKRHAGEAAEVLS